MVDILAEDFENATNSTNFKVFDETTILSWGPHDGDPMMGLKSQKLSPVIIRLNLPRVQNDATNDGFSYFVWFRSGSGFWKKNWKILDKNFRLFCDDMIISKLQNSSSKAASSTFFLNHKLIVLRSFIFDCLAKLRKHQWFFSYRGQNLYQWLFSVSGFSVELQKK